LQSGDDWARGGAACDVEGVVAVVRAMTVVASVKRDLAALAKLDPDLAQSALAASALVLARQLDNSKTSATSKSMCARTLLDTLDRLRELAPEEQEDDQLDQLSARRAARIAGRAAT
jgi:hypothetical protein